MKKLIAYFALSLMLVVGFSCSDQLQIDERQTTFDARYFTYSRFQLTTAIVNVAKNYGEAAKDPQKGHAALYFFDCYAGDEMSKFYTANEQNWNFQGSNPYTNELRKLEAINKLATDEGNMANVAAADILKCVVGAYLTEKYGDIPFSEAVEGREGNLFPKFDSQQSVYESMFALLDNAISILSDASSKGLPADHDVLFGGDKSKWLKFANSLKFRLMMHSYDAFKSAGKDLSGELQAIASGNNYMSEVSDNASLAFSGTEDSQSWYLETKYDATGNDFTEQKPTKYLIDQMVKFDDPRMYVIFAPVVSPWSTKTEETEENLRINGYDYTITHYPSSLAEASELVATGRDLNGNAIDVPYELDARWFGTPSSINVQLLYGGNGLGGSNYYNNNRITGFSKLIAETHGSELKAVMMESSEIMFLLAEARQKGLISAGTAKDYYEKGIKLSFDRWGIVDGTKPATYIGSEQIVDNYNAYLAQEGVALDGTAGDLDKIALQKWLSMVLTNQTEAFTDFLRTGKPAFVGKIAPSFTIYDYPERYIYPQDELSNNSENYDAAVSALGGKDLPSAKMWIRK